MKSCKDDVEKYTNVTAHADSKLIFKNLQNQLEFVKLPDKRWCYTKGNETFFGFQRVEENYKVLKRVAVFNNMEIRIYFNNKVMPFSPYIKVTNVEEFNNLLKTINEVNVNAVEMTNVI